MKYMQDEEVMAKLGRKFQEAMKDPQLQARLKSAQDAAAAQNGGEEEEEEEEATVLSLASEGEAAAGAGGRRRLLGSMQENLAARPACVACQLRLCGPTLSPPAAPALGASPPRLQATWRRSRSCWRRRAWM